VDCQASARSRSNAPAARGADRRAWVALKASQLVKIARRSFRAPKARVASSGAGSAFPAQTTYIARDDGLDGEGIGTAEEQLAPGGAAASFRFPTSRRNPGSRSRTLCTTRRRAALVHES
jgi:hypothetical protein